MRIEIGTPYGKGKTKPNIGVYGGRFDSPTAVAKAYLEVERTLGAGKVKSSKPKKEES